MTRQNSQTNPQAQRITHKTSHAVGCAFSLRGWAANPILAPNGASTRAIPPSLYSSLAY